MDKTNIGNQGFTLPMPQSILGSVNNGQPNYMALGWQTRVNHLPPLMGIGVHRSHLSFELIQKNRVFSLNFPSREMLKVTDYVGLVSGKRNDKSSLFETLDGETGAPLIKECPLNVECTVYQQVDLPSNTLFIGEIKATWCEERFMTDGTPDAAKIEPFVLTMPDNLFWSLGDCIGRAWHDGKVLKESS